MFKMYKPSDLFCVLSTNTWIRLTIAFGLLLLTTVLFIQLADEVGGRETLPFDEAILRAVNSTSSPFLDGFSLGLTQLGGVSGVFILTAGIALFLWQRGKRKSAALLAIGVSGAGLLNILLKAVYQRDRPELWERIVTENSYSFPSGHAMASSALALSLIVVFWPTRWRWLVFVASVIYMVAIGLTRLYLGVHYPTDVIAGWMVSGVWVMAVVIIVRFRTRLLHLLKNKSIDNW